MTRNSPDRLAETVLTLAGNDDGLVDEAKYLVLAALESDQLLADALAGEYVPPPQQHLPGPPPEPVGAFLKSISVSGFRGVGAAASLDLHPAPGLTVVAGRNGSGKSTFAEALEVALTSTSYRWRERSAGWQRDWANLHSPRPREIRVDIAEEGIGTTTVGVDWPDASERFDDLRHWVQRPGRKREAGTAGLGWAEAIGLYRPLLSYEEVGTLLTSAPSKLYDTLLGILGLERLTDAQRRLDAQRLSAEEPAKIAKVAGATLKRMLADHPDERAGEVLRLIRKHAVDLDAVRALATGSAPTATMVLARLRALADTELPGQADTEDVAIRLDEAVKDLADRADVAATRASRRIELLRQAVEMHDEHAADLMCPVCGEGTLTGPWRTAAGAELDGAAEEVRALGAARRELMTRRGVADRLLAAVDALVPPPGVALAFLSCAEAAREAWTAAPNEDAALAEHLRRHVGELRAAITALKEEAEVAWQERQDAWAPAATEVATWVGLTERAQVTAPRATLLGAACTWLRDRTEQLRNEQLAPLADDARHIWAALRQESNVDLTTITLPTPVGNVRRVEIAAAVDGADAGALGVMSTGELHALALALFIPRATRPESPFRFIVLDDPIQAMDPSKIDGFVTVLAELAATRQVVVFSHDDRLPEAMRRLAGNARIIEVTRTAGSLVTLDDSCDPARRDIADACALVSDSKAELPIVRAVVPRLCRSAVETAARDRFFARSFAAGRERHEVESAWGAVRNQPHRIALALHGDTRSIDRWLDAQPHRRAALEVCGAGSHYGLAGNIRTIAGAVDDVAKLVADVKAGTP